jgi:hypothetical protein
VLQLLESSLSPETGIRFGESGAHQSYLVRAIISTAVLHTTGNWTVFLLVNELYDSVRWSPQFSWPVRPLLHQRYLELLL